VELNRNELKKAYRISAIIGIFMAANNFVLAFCMEILIKTSPQPIVDSVPKKAVDIIFTIVVVISIGMYFLIPFMRKQILSNKTNTGNQPLSFSPHVQKLFSASLVSSILCSSVCVYGFFMFFLTWNNIYYYPFMVLSLIFFGMFFQRYNQWEEWMQKKQ